MSLTGTTTRTDTVGDGSTDYFDFTWRCDDAAWVKVYVDGVLQVSGYTVALNANQDSSPGGRVTFSTAPADQAPVSLRRDIPLTQQTSLTPYSPFPAKTLERGLDRVVMQLQGMNARVSDDPTAQAIASAQDAADSEAAAAASAVAAAASAVLADADAAAAAADASAADSARTAAESARDSALAAGNIFASIAAAVPGGTAPGDYFFVPVSGNPTSFICYLNVDDTVPNVQEICRLVSTVAIATKLPDISAEGMAWGVEDGAGLVALGIKTDGTVQANEIAATKNGTDNAKLTEVTPGTKVAWGLVDADRQVALGVRDDGTVEAGDLVVENLSATDIAGVRTDRLVALVDPPSFVGGLVYVNNMGQSLATGPGGEISNTQEYDTVGFAMNASSPGAYLTAINDNTSNGYEPPMYGTAAMAKKLIQDEDGLAPGDLTFQLLLCTNGAGDQSIAQLSKGTSYYTNAMSQVQSLLTIAQSEGRTCRVGAITWTQGERDAYLGTTESAYKAALVQLADDFDADCKAITGQTERVPLVCYQTCSAQYIAVAQLNASIENPTKIFCVTPTYQFGYLDTVHIGVVDSKWLGAYYGLAVKRLIVDGESTWESLRPISHLRQGTVLDVRFNKRGLVFDTTGVPAQTNYGFSLLDNLGAGITISSVTIIRPDTVRIVAAATIPASSTLRYGMTACSGKSPYVGGAGNLRDGQGDTVLAHLLGISKPLHNWCSIFTRTLP